jgi:hypothetical protein
MHRDDWQDDDDVVVGGGGGVLAKPHCHHA